jgi:signal transduction histidine kinase
MIAHEIRGRLHAARLHLTFLERAFRSPDDDPEIVDAVKAAAEELRQLEQLVLASFELPARPETETQ